MTTERSTVSARSTSAAVQTDASGSDRQPGAARVLRLYGQQPVDDVDHRWLPAAH